MVDDGGTAKDAIAALGFKVVADEGQLRDIVRRVIAANAKAWPGIAEGIRLLGVCAGPDDVFLAMRGLRTLSVRLAQHQRSALEIARWLAARPEIIKVLYPALESDPGHAIWKRDFSGASGLFSVILKPAPKHAVDALLGILL